MTNNTTNDRCNAGTSTVDLLMREYGAADIELERVTDKYLAISRKEAFRRANRGDLPFPAYRAGSAKSPWMVRVTDLAEHLDSARLEFVSRHAVENELERKAG
ncbi:pyocin activator PrtN family protein [Thioalkalivibrio sp. ALMg11]|uniref:pyocin activator PrtN family protein n=1 Tax=Thioalkalivibrio sp. ALMg11 TaxID=1158165 RepID=UPI00036A5211|nr:pyocin activator PrtN family protein [Thioalkalivibrio sp. ALMg11]